MLLSHHRFQTHTHVDVMQAKRTCEKATLFDGDADFVGFDYRETSYETYNTVNSLSGEAHGTPQKLFT